MQAPLQWVPSQRRRGIEIKMIYVCLFVNHTFFFMKTHAVEPSRGALPASICLGYHLQYPTLTGEASPRGSCKAPSEWNFPLGLFTPAEPMRCQTFPLEPSDLRCDRFRVGIGQKTRYTLGMAFCQDRSWHLVLH